MTQATDTPRAVNQPKSANPYPRSWMDSLILWIQTIPGPSWLFYAATLLTLALLNNAVFWLDGSLDPGSFRPIRLADAGYIIFPIALYQYLAQVAGRSFKVFRPVLQAPVSDQRSLEYQITNMPRRLGWLAIILGSAFAVQTVQSDPASVGVDAARTVLPIIYQSINLSIALSTILALTTQTFRQLRLVNNLHRRASRINLFELAPAHAFASLTASTGIGLILFIVYNVVVEQSNITEINLILIAIIGILAIAVFFLPLLGMRNRLKDEKARLLGEASARIQQTIGRIYEQVDSNRHENISDLKVAMSALIEGRNLLEGISTWPWDPDTLRGFATSLLLPILLWLVTTLLGRLI